MKNDNQVLLFGELLLRLSPPWNRKLIQTDLLEMHWAGSEANIAVSLACFGERTAFITAVPDNELARMGINALQKYGVDIAGTRIEGERIGTFFYEPGSGLRNGKIIYDRKYSSFSDLKPGMIDWDKALANCNWFHWSGINAGISAELAEVCREALEAASRRGVFISADCNHRNALWKYGKHPRDIMPPLLQYCDLIIADMTVGKMYFDIDVEQQDPVATFLRRISQEFRKNSSVALTMRGKIQGEGRDTDYRGFLFENSELFASSVYSLENTIERIGSGDAFMAGLIYAKRNGLSPTATIDFATAAGAIKHSVMGDFNLTSVQDVNSIRNNPRAGTILR